MTPSERGLHERVDTKINNALMELVADFDIKARDYAYSDLQGIRSNLREFLFRAYQKNHHV